jgi:hypothetical protein
MAGRCSATSTRLSEGAQVIADIDDDNIPKDGWTCPEFEGAFDVIAGCGFVNVYRYFTDAFVWPRLSPTLATCRRSCDPAERGDRRLAVSLRMRIQTSTRCIASCSTVRSRSPSARRSSSTVASCPFNSQNTVFARGAFPLLYLPAFMTFRFTDILRGLVAQPALWAHGLRLAFGSATVRQERNPHGYLKDFADEVPMNLHAEAAFDAAFAATSVDAPLAENLRASYERREECGIVELRERTLLDAWLNDVARLTA